MALRALALAGLALAAFAAGAGAVATAGVVDGGLEDGDHCEYAVVGVLAWIWIRAFQMGLYRG